MNSIFFNFPCHLSLSWLSVFCCHNINGNILYLIYGVLVQPALIRNCVSTQLVRLQGRSQQPHDVQQVLWSSCWDGLTHRASILLQIFSQVTRLEWLKVLCRLARQKCSVLMEESSGVQCARSWTEMQEFNSAVIRLWRLFYFLQTGQESIF